MAYKDSLFRSIFGNARSALNLYNALHGTAYTEQDTEVVINTLDETLWTWRKNDLSFLVNRSLIVVAEHQSTINENMPFRFLRYACRLFENSIEDRKAVYRKERIGFFRPRFILCYNGHEDLPDRKTMLLSDSYMDVPGFEEVKLELEVEVYNINDGRNRGIIEACEELKGYAYFALRADLHRQDLAGRGETAGREALTREAIKRAIRDCRKAGLLVEFWENLSAEEMNMLVTEWSLETALEVSKEEGEQRGERRGIRIGEQRGEQRGIRIGEQRGIELGANQVLELIDKGYTVEDIRRELRAKAETADQ